MLRLVACPKDSPWTITVHLVFFDKSLLLEGQVWFVDIFIRIFLDKKLRKDENQADKVLIRPVKVFGPVPPFLKIWLPAGLSEKFSSFLIAFLWDSPSNFRSTFLLVFKIGCTSQANNYRHQNSFKPWFISFDLTLIHLPIDVIFWLKSRV